jgi:hypothetical protein
MNRMQPVIRKTSRLRKGSTIVLLVVVALALMGFMALVSSQQLSSSRAVMEHCQTLRIRDLAVDSVIEEICSAVETALPTQSSTIPQTGRDLSRVVSWPGASGSLLSQSHQLQPSLTRDEFKKDGVSLPDSVVVQTGSWYSIPAPASSGAGSSGYDLGILQVSFRIKVKTTSRSGDWKVTVRRYMMTCPTNKTDKLGFRVLPQNLAMEVKSLS